MNLPNDVENEEKDKKSLLSILNYKTDNYVIIEDILKKMILIMYRIKANIPIIIMGETGCGITILITKLNQILNNGVLTVRKINICPNITIKDIYEIMKKIIEEATCVKDDIWVFFEEINKCNLLIGKYNINRKNKNSIEKC